MTLLPIPTRRPSASPAPFPFGKTLWHWAKARDYRSDLGNIIGEVEISAWMSESSDQKFGLLIRSRKDQRRGWDFCAEVGNIGLKIWTSDPISKRSSQKLGFLRRSREHRIRDLDF